MVLRLALATIALALNSAQAATIEIFVKQGCSYCDQAKTFLQELKNQSPELQITERDILKDPAAIDELRNIAETLHLQQIGVPTFRIGKRVIVGFSGPEGTGREIREALAMKRGPPSFESRWGKLNVADYGLPIFTVILGLIDGFNPCALWVLLFILSLLIHLKSRKRMLAVAGTFVFISGAVYFAFMAAWLNFFMLLGSARWIQVVLACVALFAGIVHVKDYFAYRVGLSLSIPDSAKPWIARQTRKVLQAENLPATLIAVSILALLVNAVELLCTAGLPAIYTQILSTQGLSEWKHYAYLLLYNVAYIFDDSLLVLGAIFTLNPQRLGETGGRRLKLVSGIVMLALALLLLFKPEWLS